MRKKILFLSTVVFVNTNPSAFAGSVAGNGGSTEVTQIMNNAELVASVGQQADMVATQINQYVTQVAQLSSMKQNLFMLPLAVVGKALGPYKDQYLPYFNAYKSVTALKDSAFRANTVLSGEISAMSRLNMTPQQYTQAMIQAAKERGGYYKQSLDSTTAALQDVQKRGEALAQLHDQIPQIDGNIKGMQTLATTNMQMIGEMQNMNAAILQQKAASEVEGKLREDEKEAAQARRLEFEKGKAAAEAWEKKIMSGGK